MAELDGKVAVITGGTSGIGFAIAQRLLQEGAKIVLLSERAQDDIDAAARELSTVPGDVAGYRCDVRHRAETRAVIDAIAAKYGRIDILINSAGVSPLDVICADDEQEARLVVDVNLNGTYNMIVSVLPTMKQQKAGCIVNVASSAAVRGPGGQALYSATKAAVLSLTQTLPQELKGQGIRVTAIGPGAVHTDMIAAIHTPTSDMAREIRAHVARMVPTPDPGGDFVLAPENIANVAFWLCTDQSWGVNGTMILVDHGLATSWSAIPPELQSLD